MVIDFKVMELSKHRIVIASDAYREGIGIEVYQDDKLVVEIFRNDNEKLRTITTYNESISLELMEECIEVFKKEIPWDFMNT